MKIGYDVRSFLKEESGVGIYVRKLISSLIEIDNDNKYYLLSSSLKDRFNKTVFKNNEKIKIKDYRIPVKILNFLWYKLKFPPMGFFFFKRLDIVHSTVPVIIPGGRKKIITVHDTCFIDKPLLVMKEAIDYFKKDFINSVKRADGIIAVSEFTKSRILDIAGKEFEDKIRVINQGCDFDEIESKKPDFDVPQKYLFFAGTIEPRKNLIRLIKAMEMVNKKDKELKLIISGKKGWAYKEILGYISKTDIQDNIIITDYISRKELKYLYEKSFAVIIPSLYEGFGFAPLEAAYTNRPVLSSDIPVFHELYSDYPLYFNPLSYEDIADKILYLLYDENIVNEKIEKGREIKQKYSWRKTAEKTLSFYKEVLG